MANNIVNNYCSTFIQIANDVVKKYESNEGIIKQTEEEKKQYALSKLTEEEKKLLGLI